MKPGRIDEKYIVLIIRETLQALNYIHKFGVIHRDIKGNHDSECRLHKADKLQKRQISWLQMKERFSFAILVSRHICKAHKPRDPHLLEHHGGWHQRLSWKGRPTLTR